jgi:hypothetical protein
MLIDKQRFEEVRLRACGVSCEYADHRFFLERLTERLF